jgi:hypothetical protein
MDTSDDHLQPQSAPMWNLTSFDIHRVKGELQARRARIDAKYAEDSKALDAEFAELEALERLAASVAIKYRAHEAPETPEESSAKAAENTAPIEDGGLPEAPAVTATVSSGGDPRTASRWRLALRD